MAERMVQVPVSLIKAAARHLYREGYPGTASMLDDALLSQPTPTAERHTHNMGDPDEWHVTRCKVCGLAASVEFMREQCRYPAAPPSIADMVPGTTFTAEGIGVPGTGHHFTVRSAPRDHGVVLFCADHGTGASPGYVDPSTIRDVTPPKETP